MEDDRPGAEGVAEQNTGSDEKGANDICKRRLASGFGRSGDCVRYRRQTRGPRARREGKDKHFHRIERSYGRFLAGPCHTRVGGSFQNRRRVHPRECLRFISPKSQSQRTCPRKSRTVWCLDECELAKSSEFVERIIFFWSTERQWGAASSHYS